MGKFIEKFLEWVNQLTGLDEWLGAALSAVFITLVVWVLQDAIRRPCALFFPEGIESCCAIFITNPKTISKCFFQ